MVKNYRCAQHRVIVTRPEGQADALLSLLDKNNFFCHQLPMLKISLLQDKKSVSSALDVLGGIDVSDAAIFISRNAVAALAEFMYCHQRDWPANLPCLAIGSATADAISENGWNLVESVAVDNPRDEGGLPAQDSESLLCHPLLQSVQGKHIVIVRGVGGRAKLAEALRSRGADVRHCELYRRSRPEYTAAAVREAFDSVRDNGGYSQTALLFSSAEAMENFHYFIFREGYADISQLGAAIVSSPRLQGRAEALGFKSIFLADNASAAASLEALTRWRSKAKR